MKLRSLLLIALVAVVFCGCHSYQPTSITVASYNLRNANGSDSAKGNGWGQRYPVIAKMVQYHDFDIFGTQECFIHQLKDMKEALPGYDYIGVGRDDGKEKGEHSAIFYRTDKFDVIEKGDFWLSETEKCDFRYATNGTFNDFDPDSFTESRIDHVFVSPVFKVKRYGVLTDTYRSIRGNGGKKDATDCPEEIDIKAYQARTPSDHFPVKVELVFEGEEQK